MLPDNVGLLKLEEAGLTHAEIAEQYNVTRQAVTWRFNNMGEYKRGPLGDVTAKLPWDLANHPAKAKLRNQQPFLGLRAFLRERLGVEVSARSQLALRAFLNRVEKGEVLAVDDVLGAHYVKRDPVRDGSLVIRWPAGVEKDDRVSLFELSAAQTGSEALLTRS
ncbi:hypothetical protein ACF05W_03410 [Streptomyces lydicus]|uniref:hypothetical protein n=1 Tax=Streptomyces lydicus TaxID=47763 RepID=UPI0036FC1D14